MATMPGDVVHRVLGLPPYTWAASPAAHRGQEGAAQ